MNKTGMKVETFEVSIPKSEIDESHLISSFRQYIDSRIPSDAIPVRFVVTKTTQDTFYCEVGCIISDEKETQYNFSLKQDSIFEFRKREFDSADKFNAALIIPTGIGLDIGGHAGDAGPAAMLLGKICDNLILHPNVVNASDINEMTENSLYIEGSVLSRFLMGTVGLQKVRSNRVLTIIEDYKNQASIHKAVNAINAARATYGLDSEKAIVLNPSFTMEAAESISGSAVGHLRHMEYLFECLEHYKGQYDAVALASIIEYDQNYIEYFKHSDEQVNPWGGAEAMLTHAISHIFDIPSAHAPLATSTTHTNAGVVDPRIAAEVVSTAYINCVLKGLVCSPRIITDPQSLNLSEVISAKDIDCLITPDNCIGLPILAALEQGMKVIAVKNNNLIGNSEVNLPWDSGQLFKADSYIEAVGIAESLKNGIHPSTLVRPLGKTSVDFFHFDKTNNSYQIADFYSKQGETLRTNIINANKDYGYEVEVEETFLVQENNTTSHCHESKKILETA